MTCPPPPPQQVTVTVAYLPLSGPRGPVQLELTQPAGAARLPRPVFSGAVRPRDRVSFVSLRRPPSAFALWASVDGVQAAQVSVCCERRRPAGARLGGAASPLLVFSVAGGGPCGRCLAAGDRLLAQHRRRLRRLQRRLRTVLRASPESRPSAELPATAMGKADPAAATALREVDATAAGSPAAAEASDTEETETSVQRASEHSDSDSGTEASDEVVEEVSSDTDESIASDVQEELA